MSQTEFTGDEPTRNTDDALMYAITGEHAPAELTDRPGYAEESARAEATVSSLRRGLQTLGAELAAASPAAATTVATAPASPAALASSTDASVVAVGRWWSRPWVVAVAAGTVGVALAAGFILQGSEPSEPETGSRSLPGVVACAETIAVGKVTGTSRQGDRLEVTLAAERYLKPDDGPGALSVSKPVSAGGAATPDPKVGDRVLVVVHDAASGNIDLFTGADIDSEWSWMERALPASRSIDPKQCQGE